MLVADHTDFHRENTLRLDVDGKSLFPDCAFTLLAPGRGPLKFFVELDNGTEPMTSPRERDSWERKIRLYEALQDRSGERFRVLGIVTRSAERLRHMLATAAAAARNPQRSLVYGSTLSAYLTQTDPLAARCFLDHRGNAVALVPAPRWSPRPAAPAARAALAGAAGA